MLLNLKKMLEQFYLKLDKNNLHFHYLIVVELK